MKLKQAMLLCLALPSALAAQAPAATPAPRITFEPQAAVVQGITPNGGVVWFSLAREVADDDVATLVRREKILLDEDGDGTVRFSLDREVPLRSIWVAVDLASGELTAAAPEGFPLQQVAWRGRGLGRDNARSDTVEDARPFAEVLIVRPGEGGGAWGLTVGDGSITDEDGAADGKIAAALDQMRPLGQGAQPPQRFDPKDVVLLIDPNRMELTVARAGEPQTGADQEP